jgi:hypothetical protein
VLVRKNKRHAKVTEQVELRDCGHDYQPTGHTRLPTQRVHERDDNRRKGARNDKERARARARARDHEREDGRKEWGVISGERERERERE